MHTRTHAPTTIESPVAPARQIQESHVHPVTVPRGMTSKRAFSHTAPTRLGYSPCVVDDGHRARLGCRKLALPTFPHCFAEDLFFSFSFFFFFFFSASRRASVAGDRGQIEISLHEPHTLFYTSLLTACELSAHARMAGNYRCSRFAYLLVRAAAACRKKKQGCREEAEVWASWESRSWQCCTCAIRVDDACCFLGFVLAGRQIRRDQASTRRRLCQW